MVPDTSSPATRILRGTWAADDRQRSPYLYLPFDLPAGTQELRVAYHTSLRSPSGTEHVDIGLFDPRGHVLGEPVGFRGWSGSARDHFMLSEHTATPGYVAGPLQPGTWHIVLGTESQRLGDVDYRVELQCSADQPPDPASGCPPFSEGVLRSGAAYYRGDLHCHTVHSDGSHPLEIVAQRARARGLDFLSITNHNVIAADAALTPTWLQEFLLIGGEEVTTYQGHLNVWGLRDWIEFRACTDADMQAIVAEAHARGALTCVNHPRTHGPDWKFGFLPDIPCLEVWNGPWPLNNYESLGVYDRLLCQGRRITAVGGSDIHVISTPEAPYLYELGNPTTHVYADELSEAGILAGLRTGRVGITADLDGAWVELRATSGSGAAVMGGGLAGGGHWDLTVDTRGLDGATAVLVADGRIVASVPVRDARGVRIPAPERYVRAQILREPAGDPADWFVYALSNPIYRTAD